MFFLGGKYLLFSNIEERNDFPQSLPASENVIVIIPYGNRLSFHLTDNSFITAALHLNLSDSISQADAQICGSIFIVTTTEFD